MSADLETILIYLQRRYNILREVCSLTEELAEAVERGDTVSASLLLDMRGEQLQRHADCEEQIILHCRLWETAFRPGIYEIWLKVH